jgi:hypothetical protein
MAWRKVKTFVVLSLAITPGASVPDCLFSVFRVILKGLYIMMCASEGLNTGACEPLPTYQHVNLSIAVSLSLTAIDRLTCWYVGRCYVNLVLRGGKTENI